MRRRCGVNRKNQRFSSSSSEQELEKRRCERGTTEISIDVASPGAGLPECVCISLPYKRRPRLLTIILYSSASGGEIF